MQKMSFFVSYDMLTDMSVDVDNSVEIGDFWRKYVMRVGNCCG